MPFFTSSRSAETRTPLPSSANPTAAISLLQDLDVFPNLQPPVVENKIITPPPQAEWLVHETTAAAPDGVTPEYRSITAAVPVGPFWTTNVTTRSGYLRTKDGIITVFHAPMGLHGRNTWRVVEGDGEGSVLVEEATLTGPALLMPFIMMTERKSHAELGAKKLQEICA